MSSFTKFTAKDLVEHQVASKLLGKTVYAVTKEFQYDIGEENSGKSVPVKEGTLISGDTVPTVVKNILLNKLDTNVAQAIVVRDVADTKLATKPDKYKDEVFFESLQVLGVNKLVIKFIKLVTRFSRLFGSRQQRNVFLQSTIESEIRRNLQEKGHVDLTDEQVEMIKSKFKDFFKKE